VLEPPKGQGASELPLERIRALGAHVEASSRHFLRITGAPAVLRQVAALEGVRGVRFPLEPVPAQGTGSIVSEAVNLVGAGALQTGGLTGAGVKVAVIDGGFMHLAEAQGIGEIPASAIGVDFTTMSLGVESGTAHGTAVTEEVADVAPGAQLYLLAFTDEVGLENAVDYVHQNGISIVNFSINFFATSYADDTGPINDIINDSHDNHGVFWAVAGGNWAYRHWRGPWVDTDNDRFLEFAAGNERLQVVPELSDVCWTLNWNQYPDSYQGALTDLDLFVYSKSNTVVASSQDRQTAGTFPAEQACYTRDPTQEPYTIAVRRFSGPTAGLDLTLVSSGAAVDGSLGVADHSVLDPSDAHGAFTVAAVDQAQWNVAMPPGPFIENFSSRGPTWDGRIKPDISAPDRTQTYYYGTSIGTSFSSPVVAGAAALLKQQQPSISANQLRAALVAHARDVGDPGLDELFGWGELVLQPLVLPLDSDGDSIPDASDPCPFAANNVCDCGDVDGTPPVTTTDELAVRIQLSNPTTLSPLMVHPELCNVYGPAGPFPIGCNIVDWVVLRRARNGLQPGIQQVCAPALPP